MSPMLDGAVLPLQDAAWGAAGSYLAPGCPELPFYRLKTGTSVVSLSEKEGSPRLSMLWLCLRSIAVTHST